MGLYYALLPFSLCLDCAGVSAPRSLTRNKNFCASHTSARFPKRHECFFQEVPGPGDQSILQSRARRFCVLVLSFSRHAASRCVFWGGDFYFTGKRQGEAGSFCYICQSGRAKGCTAQIRGQFSPIVLRESWPPDFALKGSATQLRKECFLH